ncbi:MAG: hypothetical protein QXP88_00660 [Thermoproteota archaeon]
MENLSNEMSISLSALKETFDRNFFYYLKDQNLVEEKFIDILELVSSYTSVNLYTTKIFFNKVKTKSVPILSIDLSKFSKVYEYIVDEEDFSNIRAEEFYMAVAFEKLLQKILQKSRNAGFYCTKKLPSPNSLLRLMLFNLYQELEKIKIKYYKRDDTYLYILPYKLKEVKKKERFFKDITRKMFFMEFIPEETEIIFNLNYLQSKRGLVAHYYSMENFIDSIYVQATKERYQSTLMQLKSVRLIENYDQEINYVYIVKDGDEISSVYLPKQYEFDIEDIGDNAVLEIDSEKIKFTTNKLLPTRVTANSTICSNKTIYSNYHKSFYTDCNLYNRILDYFSFRLVF